MGQLLPIRSISPRCLDVNLLEHQLYLDYIFLGVKALRVLNSLMTCWWVRATGFIWQQPWRRTRCQLLWRSWHPVCVRLEVHWLSLRVFAVT